MLHKAHLNTPSAEGLISDKLHVVIELAREAGFSVKTVLRGPSTKLNKVAYSLSRLEVSISVAKIQHFLAELMNLYDKKKTVFENRKIIHPAWLRASWEWTLTKYDPCLVCGIGLSSIAIDSAKKRLIPTLEVQHGLHPDGYLQKMFPSEKPDYYFAWFEWDRQLFDVLKIKKIVTGHPILRSKSVSSGKISKVQPFLCFATSYRKNHGLTRRLLGPVRPDIDRRVKAGIQKAFEMGFKIAIRPHPVIASRPIQNSIHFLSMKFRWPKASILNPKRTSLAEMVSASIGLVTVSSGTAFEFAIMGKQVLVMDLKKRLEKIEKYIGTV